MCLASQILGVITQHPQKRNFSLRWCIKINKWNIANMCGICLEKPVDHFIDPCGHTFCGGCIKEQFKVDSIDEIKIYAERNNLKCPVCRFCPVNTAKPLYFL